MFEKDNELLKIKNLQISFNTPSGTFPAVKDVSFEVNRHHIMGIVGESGCGKSVTSLSIMKLLPSNAVCKGTIEFLGADINRMEEKRIRELRGDDISMIFQEPLTSLNPLWKVGKQIDENLKMHTALDKKGRYQEVLDIMKDVGLPDTENLYHKYPHELSGGMRQRIGIAIAIACKPKLIIADEPTTALDVTIQAQILELLKEINATKGSSIIFISHDLGVIKEICQEVCVMYAGYIVEKASVHKLFEAPKHPYTMGLIKSIPTTASKGKRLFDIPGKVPSITDTIPGCPFEPRCPYKKPRCAQEFPEFHPIDEGHDSRCFFAGDF
ncbi:MAG TPA: ABC transporter ATP-binding protein [Thermotogota bacterium]|nr:ABC transporter ATP-binding protein [Thermotogota bacterium]HPJ89807.1 ABC transporter ATP-binding protein [Thermotogota bacterium]HPR96980.1 ABC transporter ATP-binding protein [Thermotogota bacterium]